MRAGRGGQAVVASSTPVHRRLVGLGDSVPAGTACTCTNYVSGAAQRLSQPGHPVVAVNLAVGGATSTSLLRTLTTARARSVVAGSDVVLMEIGANDFDAGLLDDPACLGALTCWAPTLRQLVVNLRALLVTLHRLRPSQPVVVVVLGYWNIARSGAVGAKGGSVFVRNARALTDRVNRLEREAAAAAGGVYVDTYAAFGSNDRTMTGLLAADGDHPNARGHAVLAAAVVAALRAARR